MKTLQFLPSVLVLLALVAGTVVLRDSGPPGDAIVAPGAYDAVLMEQLSLEDVTRKANLIVHGKVTSVQSRRTSKTVVTDVTVEVTGTLKGNTGKTFTMTLEGGIAGGIGVAVGGVPNFLKNEKVLLFLDNASSKLPVGLWQGKYTLAGDEAIQPNANSRVPISTIESRLGKALGKPVDIPEGGPVTSSDPFTAVGHNNTASSYDCPPWSSAALPIVVDVNAADPGSGGPAGSNFARVVYNSLHSWQALNDSYVAFSFGTTTNRGAAVDGLKTVLWGQIRDANGVIIPGVLAVNNCAWYVGGSRMDSDTTVSNVNFTWDPDDSNGISSTAYSLQAVLEHELGHGLSLGHTEVSCNGSASTPLMCPAVANGVRKTILADDRAGAAYLYPISGSAPGAPTGLAVTGSGSSLTLNWTASSGTKHAYDIERSSSGCAGTFKSINTVAGNVTTFVDNNYGDGLGAGSWCYRVKALGTGGDSAWSNTAAPGGGATPTPTATNTPAPTATNTPAPTATKTPIPTATNTPTPIATNTATPTNTPSPTATPTPPPGDPQTVSVSPNSGSVYVNTATTLTARFRHTGSYTQLKRNDLIIASSSSSLLDGCWLAYRADLNRLYLRADNGAFLNAGIPGSGTTVQNSRCTLDGGTTTVSASGTDVIVNFNVSFKTAFAGAYNEYMQNDELSGQWSALTDRGDLFVAVQGVPQTVSASPATGAVDAGVETTLTATFRHTGSYTQLKRNDLIVATSGSNALNGCWLIYRADLDRLYLRAKNGAYLVAGSPGAGYTVENERCALDGNASSVTASGTDVTVNFSVTFKPEFSGWYNQYMQNEDLLTGTWSALTDRGDLTVVAEGDPQTVGVSPSAGTVEANVAQTVSATFRHTGSYSQLKRNDLIIAGSSGAPLEGCWLIYRADLNRLYLRADNGSFLDAGAPGGGGVVQNSRCILSAAGSSHLAAETDLTVGFRVTFKSAFIGSYNMYLQNEDKMTGVWSSLTDHGDLVIE